MKLFVFSSVVCFFAGCQTIIPSANECVFVPAVYETVAHVDSGHDNSELVTIPAVIDPLTGEVLFPAYTHDPKPSTKILSSETRRMIKYPARYELVNKGKGPAKVRDIQHFEELQKTRSCDPLKPI